MNNNVNSELLVRQVKLLVQSFRKNGHLQANADPLRWTQVSKCEELEEECEFLLKQVEPTLQFNLEQVGLQSIHKENDCATIQEIINFLQQVYCENISAQFSTLPPNEYSWFAHEMESLIQEELTHEEQLRALKVLLESEGFDRFMATKYPNVKRHGLEGCESMVYAMDILFSQLSKNDSSNVVLGMPHRGRFNLMTNLLNFPARAFFSKVKGHCEFPEDLLTTGDVLSHLSVNNDLEYGDRKLKVCLLPNPSHLEAIDSVAVGKTYSKQRHGKNSACVLLHGDSSFTGQGIVAELFTLSQIPHFTVKGTIHIVLNNQIGFTTSSAQARSSRHAGDVGKMINCPVLTVNIEDVNAVKRVMTVAAKYRANFAKDIVIELVGYRRNGHNETDDEPSYYKPKFYQIIRKRPTFPTAYSEQCVESNLVSATQVQDIRNQYESHLDSEYVLADGYKPERQRYTGNWKEIVQVPDFSKLSMPITGYSSEKLRQIAIASVSTPEGFKVNSLLKSTIVSNRLKAFQHESDGQVLVDWPTAEILAFASLLQEGCHVRLSGQDMNRGTANQRHWQLVDQETEQPIIPFLEAIPESNRNFELAQSPLSELSIMGFEYGFSIDHPNNFTVNEVQFGDFFNGAQAIVDCFISSGEDKWCLSSGMVVVLPHGIDGGGPEHSSGRVERFLQLCDSSVNSEDLEEKRVNMCIVNCSTPANYFHVLRRQMKRQFRKPLVVFAPKVLLKKKECVSQLSEFSEGTVFKKILLDDCFQEDVSSVKRILFCTGKVYYDLIDERRRRGLEKEIMIIRIEQLYPFPSQDLLTTMQKWNRDDSWKGVEFMWVQEEHENQGAYLFVTPRLTKTIKTLCKGDSREQWIKYAGREPCSSPATGLVFVHQQEIKDIMNTSFKC